MILNGLAFGVLDAEELSDFERGLRTQLDLEVSKLELGPEEGSPDCNDADATRFSALCCFCR